MVQILNLSFFLSLSKVLKYHNIEETDCVSGCWGGAGRWTELKAAGVRSHLQSLVLSYNGKVTNQQGCKVTNSDSENYQNQGKVTNLQAYNAR